jgi:hypothetical protein
VLFRSVQIFPALLLAGPALALAVDWIRRRPIDRARPRLILAAFVALAIVVALSCTVNGLGLWTDFFHNSLKHAASASANRIGIGQPAVVFGWPSTVTWLVRVGFAALWLVTLLRQRTDGDRATLSVLLPPAMFNLSSYYLAILTGLAPWLTKPLGAASALMVLTVVPQLMALLSGGIPGPGTYAAISVLFILGGVALLIGARREPGRAAVPGETVTIGKK